MRAPLLAFELVLVLLLVACRRLLDSLTLSCVFALPFDALVALAERGLPVTVPVAVEVGVSSSSTSVAFFAVGAAAGAELDLELVRLVLAVPPPLPLTDGLDDDDGREGMLARTPPPRSPGDAAAAGEADLRVLMASNAGRFLNAQITPTLH